MAEISSYPIIAPKVQDVLVGTETYVEGIAEDLQYKVLQIYQPQLVILEHLLLSMQLQVEQVLILVLLTLYY